MSELETKRIFRPSRDEVSSRMVSDFVGNTPFVQLSEKIYAKLEWQVGKIKPNDSIFNYFIHFV